MFAVLSISTAVRSSQRFPWETLCPGGHSSTANSMRDSQTAGGREENTEAAVVSQAQLHSPPTLTLSHSDFYSR